MEETQEIADALATIIKLLVDSPNELSLTIVHDKSTVIFRVTASPKDVGMLIGKQGRIARSLRTILASISMRTKQKIGLDIA
jgi:predicted RNA-binding protein YlqC (UPF0109 family)